ncbi:MAG: ATP-binding protein [Dehalococcoidia bacterium]
MPSWFYSIRFRLITGFVLVLTLALVSVSLYVGVAAQGETERLQGDFDKIRADRLERLVSQFYSSRRNLSGLQTVIEQAGSLYGRRILLRNSEGQIVADSHEKFGPPGPLLERQRQFVSILSRDNEIGSLLIATGDIPEVAPDPAVSRLASSVNQSLLWAGLAAGAGGILLISIVSRRILAPIGVLTSAAQRLGRGDLSQRVPTSARDEFGQLGRTFNSMAEGLESAEQQRRRLVADVAHELRTPLSNIRGYLEAVQDGLLQADEATIDIIYQQVLHLTRLVEDLRLLALAEAGALRMDLSLDSLEDVLRKAVEAIRPRAEAGGLSLSIEISSELPLVPMDRMRIAQLMGNLLENAISHTPRGGSITVSAEHIRDVARVTVADTGEGISADDLPQVFERFYRVDPSRARTTGGAGLGLTIVKQLVEAHGGVIEAESSPGKGSRFIFDLPLASPSQAPEAGTRGDKG